MIPSSLPPAQVAEQPGNGVPFRLLTATDAAEALAISQRKLWQLTKDNLVPHIRIGRNVRYDPQDLRDWVEKQKQGEV